MLTAGASSLAQYLPVNAGNERVKFLGQFFIFEVIVDNLEPLPKIVDYPVVSYDNDSHYYHSNT